MKQPASARKSSRSSASSRQLTKPAVRGAEELVICVKNAGYEASLELRKIYRTVEDEDAKYSVHCLRPGLLTLPASARSSTQTLN